MGSFYGCCLLFACLILLYSSTARATAVTDRILRMRNSSPSSVENLLYYPQSKLISLLVLLARCNSRFSREMPSTLEWCTRFSMKVFKCCTRSFSWLIHSCLGTICAILFVEKAKCKLMVPKVHWTRPPKTLFKINTNGSSNRKLGLRGGGGVIRSYTGIDSSFCISFQ